MPSKTVKELESVFEPQSVAVIGASSTEGKVGYSVMKNIEESEFKGEVFPINIKADSIMGYKAYKSVLDVQEDIDLAVICIPAKFVVSVVKECGEKGVKSIVVITAGFKEVGPEGAKMEREISELAQKHGMRIIGPNCLGVITNANFSFASITPKKGSIAMLSQSGAMMTGLLDWAVEQDIGFSSFISLGNKCDVDEIDFIEYLAQDNDTKVIAGYIESITNGDKFFEVVSKATKKKPVILLKSGRSEHGAKAASSHTGALAGSDIAFDLAFEKAGVIRADTISELFNYALSFKMVPSPKGDKFSIITNAGGPGIVATDAMEEEGLTFSSFSDDTINKLDEGLPEEAALYNPVDIIGDAPPERYEFAMKTLYEAPHSEVAGSIVILTPQAQTDPLNAAKKISKVSNEYPEKVTVSAFIGGKSVSEPSKILTKAGVPTYPFPEEGVKVLKGLWKYKNILEQPIITEKEVPRVEVDLKRVEGIIKDVKKDGRTQLLSHEAAEVFEIYGIKAPKSRLAKTAREAANLAEELGFPLVAKIVSPQIIHKWDVGGVILDIEDAQSAKDAFIRIMNNVQKMSRDVRIYGVELQEMITKEDKKKVNELIIGMSRDATFGPQLMVGSGGIYANYTKDVAFDLAFHFDKDDALNLLEKTRVYSILRGVRGEPRSAIDGVVDILVKISQFVNDFNNIMELDINPCLVFEEEEGYSAVDIKITIK